MCPPLVLEGAATTPFVGERNRKVTTTIVLLDTADHDTVDAWKPQGQTREKKNMKRAHPSLGGGSGVSSLEVLELDSCSTYTID